MKLTFQGDFLEQFLNLNVEISGLMQGDQGHYVGEFGCKLEDHIESIYIFEIQLCLSKDKHLKISIKVSVESFD